MSANSPKDLYEATYSELDTFRENFFDTYEDFQSWQEENGLIAEGDDEEMNEEEIDETGSV